jgi:hypothetical protein
MSLALNPEPRTLLTAQISIGRARAFSVSLDTAGASLPEEECFRFALHYYARVLAELAKRRSVYRLPMWIGRIGESRIDGDADLFVIAGIEGTLVRSVVRPVATFDMSFRTAGMRDRELAGDLPCLGGARLARSVIAVCQAILPLLSDPIRAAVPAALANMNASYEMTHRYADPEAEREVPAIAYLAASFV